jgi:type IV secretion system protein VirB5
MCDLKSLLRASLIALLLAAPAARAQWAVIDVGAIAQLIQQVQLIEQQLATAQSDLQQAQQTYRAMTGNRGMQQLLAGINYNYLPTSAAELQGLFTQQPTAYPALAVAVQQNVAANAVLTATQLGALPAQSAGQLQAVRLSTAVQQAIAGASLATSSSRFMSLQQLIAAIGAAGDQKAALDLQARIAAEQSMLQNDTQKLQVLFQAVQAQQQTLAQRAREQIVAGHGNFLARFQPEP